MQVHAVELVLGPAARGLRRFGYAQQPGLQLWWRCGCRAEGETNRDLEVRLCEEHRRVFYEDYEYFKLIVKAHAPARMG